VLKKRSDSDRKIFPRTYLPIEGLRCLRQGSAGISFGADSAVVKENAQLQHKQLAVQAH
jgi:hypothetical protein